jgi:hypothetical protein
MRLAPVPMLKRDGAAICALRFIPIPSHGAHPPSDAVEAPAPTSATNGAGAMPSRGRR